MSDGKIEIGIELEADEAKNQASKDGKQVGEAFADGVEKGAEPVSKDLPDAVAAAAKKAKDPAGDGGKKAGAAFGEKFSDAAKSAMGGLGAKIAAGAGIGAAIGGAFSSIDVANEYNEDMGKLSTAFTSVGRSAEEGEAAYRQFVGILGETDQSVEAVNHLAELTNNSEELAEWGTIAAGVYAKFGDSLPIEGLTEAANETAKVGQVTGPLADALNWAGKSEEEFNAELAALATEEERAAYITETLSGLYEEAGNTYLETNDALVQYRESQAGLNDAMAGIGEILMPVVAHVTDLAAAFIENLQPAVQWFVDNLPAIVETFRQWAPVLAGVVGGFLAFQAVLGISALIQTVTGAMTALKTATGATTIAQALLNAVMAANPMTIVITLIGALVAAFATLLLTNEDFRAKVIEIWEAVKAKASEVFGAIASFFTETIPTAVQGMIDKFGEFKEAVTSKFDEVKANIETFVTDVITWFEDLPKRITEIGKNIVTGLWDGISSMGEWLWGQIGGFVDSIVSKFTGDLEINSPSKLIGRKVGAPIAEGIAWGYEKAPDPFAQISRTVKLGAASLSLAAGGSNTYNTTSQVVNFNQPVQSAAQVARAMRLQQAYGLAGAR